MVSFDWSNNTGAIYVKIDGSLLVKKSSFMMVRLTFSSTLDWGFYISLLLKLPPTNMEP